MKRLAALLEGKPVTAAALAAAAERAEGEALAARARVAELTQRRAVLLLDGEDAALDRVEAELTRTQRDADRGELMAAELRRRQAETEIAEAQAAREALHARGMAAQRRGVELMHGKYAKAAQALLTIAEEIEAAEEEIATVNQELRGAGDTRKVSSVDFVARPRFNEHDRFMTGFFAALCLPSPTDPRGTLYPAQDPRAAFLAHRHIASDHREAPLT